jgi:hypothetical protein
MTYSQVWDPMNNAVNPNIIKRDEDSAFIPNDPANSDYQEYLEWLDKGNKPTPAMPPEPPQAA